MRVLTHVLSRRPKGLPTSKYVATLLKRVFSSERARPRGEINVIFVDERRIKSLNRTFLNEHGATDVIAFNYEASGAKGDEAPFGDIYICVPQAASNARRFGQTFETEISRLVIHGGLHLLGYEDEKRPLQSKMWAKQEALVKRLRLH